MKEKYNEVNKMFGSKIEILEDKYNKLQEV